MMMFSRKVSIIQQQPPLQQEMHQMRMRVHSSCNSSCSNANNFRVNRRDGKSYSSIQGRRSVSGSKKLRGEAGLLFLMLSSFSSACTAQQHAQRRHIISRVSNNNDDESSDELDQREDQTSRISSEDGEKGEFVLPIFPLGLVALPDGVVPLHIFEARYRVLFNTLLHGEKDVDDDMVDMESPFRGTKKFGISCIFAKKGTDTSGDESQPSTVATVGTIMDITKHYLLQDGQMDILTEGKKRYKIVDVIQEKPILLCRVKTLFDDDIETGASSYVPEKSSDTASTDAENVQLSTYAEEIKDIFVRLMTMANRLKGKEDQMNERLELKTMSPTSLSFFLSSLFSTTEQKQAMLEVTSTKLRLEMCRNVLEESLKVYSAASAIQGAFNEEDTKDNEE